MNRFKFLLVSIALFFVGPAFAESVAHVVLVDQTAYAQNGDRAVRLVVGSEISNGDVIVTDESGLAHIRFADNTRMLVGPNSRLEIDNILMRTETKAETFAVNAVSGAFRFLSGESPKEAYTISTPTATMGIRGTAFDFFSTDSQLHVFMIGGIVLSCLDDGSRCQRLRHRCLASIADGESGEYYNPQNRSEQIALVLNSFPWIEDQSEVLGKFKALTGICGPMDQRAIDEGEISEELLDLLEEAGDVNNPGGSVGGGSAGGGGGGAGGGGTGGETPPGEEPPADSGSGKGNCGNDREVGDAKNCKK